MELEVNGGFVRSEEHTSELQSRREIVCRLLLEKKNAADNAWWLDVLENGPASVCADYFDIDWNPPAEHLAHRVLLPVLADHYGIELTAGKLVLEFNPATGAFGVRYYEHHLPIDPREYPRILARAVREVESKGAPLAHHAQALRSIAEAFERLPGRDTRSQPAR